MLHKPDIFKHPQVVCDGYGVKWNDDLGVAAEEI
jgi:hypothetical protein